LFLIYKGFHNLNFQVEPDISALKQLREAKERIKSEIAKVIVGQEAVIEQLLIALLARGHCLLIGVPGLAKSLLISTLAKALELKFTRIQFTPDLMPSDITGTDLIQEDPDSGRKVFKFFRGPVFSNIILADEINRTPPKTQSALLQAMQEHEVSAGGTTYKLDEPFFVLATQNPIEQEGTYPLPEAQLDRFMFNLMIDYPLKSEEREIVRTTTSRYSSSVDRVLDADDIIALQDLIRSVPVAEGVIEYAVNLARKTRPLKDDAPDFIRKYLNWGAGPRASQYLILGAKTRAALDGRPTPEEADVRDLAFPVLRHRLVTSFAAEADSINPDEIIKRILDII
jgi:MoxR-like ATPase